MMGKDVVDNRNQFLSRSVSIKRPAPATDHLRPRKMSIIDSQTLESLKLPLGHRRSGDSGNRATNGLALANPVDNGMSRFLEQGGASSPSSKSRAPFFYVDDHPVMRVGDGTARSHISIVVGEYARPFRPRPVSRASNAIDSHRRDDQAAPGTSFASDKPMKTSPSNILAGGRKHSTKVSDNDENGGADTAQLVAPPEVPAHRHSTAKLFLDYDPDTDSELGSHVEPDQLEVFAPPKRPIRHRVSRKLIVLPDDEDDDEDSRQDIAFHSNQGTTTAVNHVRKSSNAAIPARSMEYVHGSMTIRDKFKALVGPGPLTDAELVAVRCSDAGIRLQKECIEYYLKSQAGQSMIEANINAVLNQTGEKSCPWNCLLCETLWIRYMTRCTSTSYVRSGMRICEHMGSHIHQYDQTVVAEHLLILLWSLDSFSCVGKHCRRSFMHPSANGSL